MKSPISVFFLSCAVAPAVWGGRVAPLPNGFSPAQGLVAAPIGDGLANRMAHSVWMAVDRGSIEFEEGSAPVLEGLIAGEPVSEEHRVFLRAYLEAALEEEEALPHTMRERLDAPEYREVNEGRFLNVFGKGENERLLLQALSRPSVHKAAQNKVAQWMAETASFLEETKEEVDAAAIKRLKTLTRVAGDAFPGENSMAAAAGKLVNSLGDGTMFYSLQGKGFWSPDMGQTIANWMRSEGLRPDSPPPPAVGSRNDRDQDAFLRAAGIFQGIEGAEPADGKALSARFPVRGTKTSFDIRDDTVIVSFGDRHFEGEILRDMVAPEGGIRAMEVRVLGWHYHLTFVGDKVEIRQWVQIVPGRDIWGWGEPRISTLEEEVPPERVLSRLGGLRHVEVE